MIVSVAPRRRQVRRHSDRHGLAPATLGLQLFLPRFEMNRVSWMVVVVSACIAVALRVSGMQTLNFSAMGALAVLCGVVVRPAWLGLVIVLAARLVTDAVLEWRTGHGWYGSMLFDYGAYALMLGLGRTMQPRHPGMMLASGFAAAMTFFVVSNLGSWAMPHESGQYLYPRTFGGLRDCFVNAIPFARGTFLGDIGFTGLFLSAWRIASARSAAPASVLEHA